jgi:hypothetical protein
MEPQEPTVLDYVKSKIMFWKKDRPLLEIPLLPPEPVPSAEGEEEFRPTSPEAPEAAPVLAEAPAVVEAPKASTPAFVIELGVDDQPEPVEDVQPQTPGQPVTGGRFPWRIVLAVLLALTAQRVMEPPEPQLMQAVIMYGLAGVLVIWSTLVGELSLAPLRPDSPEPLSLRYRPALWISFGFMLLAFWFFKSSEERFWFTRLNVFLWFTAIALFLWGLWDPNRAALERWRQRLTAFVRQPTLTFKVSGFVILLLLAAGLVFYFRTHMLAQVPGEMISDQAEKLLDVNDLLDGQTKIFFERNTGREFFQFYLTALVSLLFNTGLTFMSLKIGTVFAGLFAVFYIYKLGVELGNKWVGLFAFVLCGIAYWPNVISRFGLRFPFYAMFAAPMIFYLLRGLRTSNRNDIILAGLFLGLGLHGYSPMRIVPVLVIMAFALYLLHAQSKGKKYPVMVAFFVFVLASLIIFLPLARYWLSNPEMFAGRAFSRLAETEKAFDQSPLYIFFSNFFKAELMFSWNNGNIWVHSIPNRPALDIVSAAMYFIGSLLVLVRYLRKRHWVDLFLLLSVPMLMMPSILSIAFPDENPSLNRTSAAIVPVFILAGLGLEAVLSSMYRRVRGRFGQGLVVALALFLLWGSASQNYGLVFETYNRQFMEGAWNTSQMGRIVRDFTEINGNPDSAYVVGWPYWVDTRLVGINAGYPLKDYAIWPDKFEETRSQPGSKMFIINPSDTESLAKLQEMYPHSELLTYHVDQYQGKDFYILITPAENQ